MEKEEEDFKIRTAAVSGLAYLYTEFDEYTQENLKKTFERMYQQMGAPGWRIIDRLLSAIRASEYLKG